MSKSKFISWDENKDYSLVKGGLFYTLLDKLGVYRDSGSGLLLRALFFSLFSWLPLLIFSLMDGTFSGREDQLGFAQDFLLHLRLLVVVPFLIWVERIIDPAFNSYMNSTRRLVPLQEEEKFERVESIVVKLLNSWIPEMIFVLLIYGFYIISQEKIIPSETRWNGIYGISRIYYFFISLPIYQFLFARWIWRWLIWASTVIKFSRMNLKIEASHADQMAGLEYLSLVPLAFCVLCLAPAIIFSAMIGEEILYAGANLGNFGFPILFFVIFIPVVNYLPLLAFIPLMIRAKTRAITRFGSLIQYHNNLFREKWMEGKLPEKESILPSLDNSSMADINTSYQQAVQGMNLIPITRDKIIYAALMLLIPFIPLIFTKYSLIEILSKLAQIVTG